MCFLRGLDGYFPYNTSVIGRSSRGKVLEVSLRNFICQIKSRQNRFLYAELCFVLFLRLKMLIHCATMSVALISVRVWPSSQRALLSWDDGYGAARQEGEIFENLTRIIPGAIAYRETPCDVLTLLFNSLSLQDSKCAAVLGPGQRSHVREGNAR